MNNLLNSTLLVYWDNILVDLAVLHNTTEFLSSYRCISPKIFQFSLINKTFRLNWENFDPIDRKLSQLLLLTNICHMIITLIKSKSAHPIIRVEPLKPRFWDNSEICLPFSRKQQQISTTCC